MAIEGMMRRLAPAVLAVGCFCAAVPLRTESKTNEEDRTKHLLEARYRTAKSLRATFFEVYLENGRTVRSEAGVAYFQRPGKMRWEYESPEASVFLVDGKTAWFYVPADHTVTRVPARESADWRTPLALLAGEAKLSRICSRINPVPDAEAESVKHDVLRCLLRGPKVALPQDEAAEKGLSDGREGGYALLEVDRVTGELARVTVHQGGGIEVVFRFANWQFNPPIAEGLFRFRAPAGVAIVDGELPTGGASPRR